MSLTVHDAAVRQKSGEPSLLGSRVTGVDGEALERHWGPSGPLLPPS